MLRIATKYEFTRLREWAVTQLRTTWPSSLDHMAPLALPHAAGKLILFLFFSLSGQIEFSKYFFSLSLGHHLSFRGSVLGWGSSLGG